jgi:hypothetical protein
MTLGIIDYSQADPMAYQSMSLAPIYTHMFGMTQMQSDLILIGSEAA